MLLEIYNRIERNCLSLRKYGKLCLRNSILWKAFWSFNWFLRREKGFYILSKLRSTWLCYGRAAKIWTRDSKVAPSPYGLRFSRVANIACSRLWVKRKYLTSSIPGGGTWPRKFPITKNKICQSEGADQ